MSSQLRVSRTLFALALGIGSLTGTAFAQQAPPTGEGDAATAAPAAAARSAASAAVSEEQQLQEKLRHMTNESSEGLEVVLRPDGSRMMDLEGQFMSIAIARVPEGPVAWRPRGGRGGVVPDRARFMIERRRVAMASDQSRSR